MNIPWWGYVILAGLSWGTYVPIIAYGGLEFGGKANARLAAILCVGLAYFVLAVIFPMILFASGTQPSPGIKTNAVVFSCLAGVAGAVGAICVVFATSTAVASATAAGLPPTSYKLYIAPIIFGLAPVINTIVSLFWHPNPKDGWNNFHFETPSPLLLVGIVLVGAGAALVLYSKEVSEAPAKPAVTAPTPPAPTEPAPEAPK
ncbi:MAG: hypothetical protein ACRC8S_13480 [Fimbriiglobus sp.]